MQEDSFHDTITKQFLCVRMYWSNHDSIQKVLVIQPYFANLLFPKYIMRNFKPKNQNCYTAVAYKKYFL